MPACRRAACLLLVVCTLLVPHPHLALAHAWLLRSSPGDGAVLPDPPGQVRLWFSESIDLPVRAVRLRGPDGRVLPTGIPQVAPDDSAELICPVHLVQRGTYELRWKVISADTHPVWGQFTFSVGAPSSLPGPWAGATPGYTRAALALQALGRWLNLLGATLVIGPLFLWRWTLGAATAGLPARARRRAWRALVALGTVGSLLVFLAVPAALLAQMAGLADSWAEALTGGSLADVFATYLGTILGLRLLCALALWSIGGLLGYLGPPGAPAGDRQAPPALLSLQMGIALVALLSTGLVSHAASTEPAGLSLALDWLHLVAMSLWVGGLVGLLRALPALSGGLAQRPAHLGPEDPDPADPGRLRWMVLAAIIPRFSSLAMACLAVLTTTGLYSALRNIGAPSQLLSTDYGRALSVKLGLVICVLAFAATNLLVLGPAFRRVAAGAIPRQGDIWSLLGPLLRAEALLLVAILAAVGVLTSLAPARSFAPLPAAVATPIGALPGRTVWVPRGSPTGIRPAVLAAGSRQGAGRWRPAYPSGSSGACWISAPTSRSQPVRATTEITAPAIHTSGCMTIPARPAERPMAITNGQ